MNNDNQLLSMVIAAHDVGASDLLLVAGAPPSIYLNTSLQSMGEKRLGAPDLKEMVMDFLDEGQRERLVEHRDLDFSFAHARSGRCRINIHYQRRSLAVAVRLIDSEIPDLEKLALPAPMADLADLPRGLVLITGPTGSGKSTTLAALLERINLRRRAHVITLEDPIEFTFKNRKSIIEQREIGDDSPSFSEALRHIVRQKPDIIMVGEMRDLETVAATLTAAETGHLVLASLHTNGASQTIDRIVDTFDSQRQEQVRSQLSLTLRAIASQTLFHNERDGGMVAAVELMIMTPAIARAIRDNNTHLISGMIETGRQLGMQTLDAAIAQLVKRGLIGHEAAMAKAADPSRLERILDLGDSAERPITPVVEGSFPGGNTTDAGADPSRRPWE